MEENQQTQMPKIISRYQANPNLEKYISDRNLLKEYQKSPYIPLKQQDTNIQSIQPRNRDQTHPFQRKYIKPRYQIRYKKNSRVRKSYRQKYQNENQEQQRDVGVQQRLNSRESRTSTYQQENTKPYIPYKQHHQEIYPSSNPTYKNELIRPQSEKLFRPKSKILSIMDETDNAIKNLQQNIETRRNRFNNQQRPNTERKSFRSQKRSQSFQKAEKKFGNDLEFLKISFVEVDKSVKRCLSRSKNRDKQPQRRAQSTRVSFRNVREIKDNIDSDFTRIYEECLSDFKFSVKGKQENRKIKKQKIRKNKQKQLRKIPRDRRNRSKSMKERNTFAKTIEEILSKCRKRTKKAMKGKSYQKKSNKNFNNKKSPKFAFSKIEDTQTNINQISPTIFDSLELSSVIKEQDPQTLVKTDLFQVTNEKKIPVLQEMPMINEIFEVSTLLSQLSEPKQKRVGKYSISYTKSGRIQYKGTWVDEKYHGWGCLYNRNDEEGDIDCLRLLEDGYIGGKWKLYEGHFTDGNKEGNGTLYFTDGSRFKGQFRQDKLFGKGVFIQKDSKEIKI